MGQTLSQEIEEKEKNEQLFKDALMLRKIEREMRQKYEEKKATLYIEALNDECLPIICAVDTFYEFLFDVKKPEVGTPDGTVSTPEATESKPENLYIHDGIGNRMKKHLQGDYLTEFLKLLKNVVDNVLKQNTGVVEERHTHVVYANMSVLRIDYYLYSTKFRGKDGNEMTTLFYFVQVGVIDMTRVRLPVLIYELTRATDSNKLGTAGDALKGIAQSSIHLHQAVQILANSAKQKEAFTTGGAGGGGGGGGAGGAGGAGEAGGAGGAGGGVGEGSGGGGGGGGGGDPTPPIEQKQLGDGSG